MDSKKDRQFSYLATERSSRRDRRKRGEAQLHFPMKRGRAALTPWTTLGRSLTRSVTGKLSLTLPHSRMEVSPLHPYTSDGQGKPLAPLTIFLNELKRIGVPAILNLGWLHVKMTVDK